MLIRIMHKSILLGILLLSPIAGAEETDSVLDKHMEGVSDAYKATKREQDGQKGAALAREAQNHFIKSFHETPKLVAKMAEGPAKQAAMARYRKMISESLVVVCELESAFLAGKLDEVAKLRDRLTEMRNAAHEEFKEAE